MRLRTILIALSALLALASCGTPEFRAAQSQCTAQWMAEIPPRMENELYERTEFRDVPTGRTVCTTEGDTTTCEAVMEREAFTVPAVRTVDRNKDRRDARIRQCTREACLAQFGNAACEV